MEIPRGFTRCDECEGHYLLGINQHVDPYTGDHVGDEEEFCDRCTYGLVPTEKLREEAVLVGRSKLWDTRTDEVVDAVLRKVAEHIGEGR